MKWSGWVDSHRANRHENERNNDMAGKRNKLQRMGYKPKQPDKCKRCIWGEWTETKQFCSRQQCVRTPLNPIHGTLAHSDHYCRNVQSKAVYVHKLYHSTMQGGKYQ
ncbi:hypothetical protein AK95_26025 [Paenibacillus sp. LC231]|nr:hypothetical protein AK95_26025 [Paenibacillus sp. LC231]